MTSPRQRRRRTTPLFLIYISFYSSLSLHVDAKEITATHEWQLLGENDTIPAGLHIKVDLSTGEKWVKLASSAEENDDDYEGIIRAASAVKEQNDYNVKTKVDVASIDASGALTIVPQDDKNHVHNNQSNTNESSTKGTTATTTRDYEMMHRVMSQLPPEELESFGGLPALPSSNNTNNDIKLTAKERKEFEAEMEILWRKRQAELQKLQDSIADLPKMIRTRIQTIKEYLMDSNSALKVMLKEKQSNHENDDDDDEGGAAEANNVVKALRDLEFQLSDVDMARDFHTLGGWPYLIALLDESLHVFANDNGDDDDIDDATAVLVNEIRALAATTIGTAVSNLEEFRPWVLEDVSSTLNYLKEKNLGEKQQDNDTYLSTATATTALSLLTHEFKEELDRRTEAMAGGTMAVEAKSNTIAKAKSQATYKLRAIYGLGSVLRGNPIAQQMFISNHLNGPDILVRNALGTLSNVRGPITDPELSRLDYKFASKVLALGEDILMDVVLHGEDYVQLDYSVTDEAKAKYVADEITTANRLKASFTTEQWCDLSLRMLSPPSELIGETNSRDLKERALSAVRAMAPSCQELSSSNRWGIEELKRVRAEWNRQDSGDGLDPGYRKELLDLVDGVLGVLQKEVGR